MNNAPRKRRRSREHLSRAVVAVVALIAVVCSPIALARSAGASYSDAYTGPGFCTAYGDNAGPQIVIDGVKTNVYECGGNPKYPGDDASPHTTGNTPFDYNGGGYGPIHGSFQCVELSLRFEYVVYKENTLWVSGKGQLLDPPTGANVVHYLNKVFHVPVAFGNGTIAVPPTSAPAPTAGNILSLGPTSINEPSGHTAVIESVKGNLSTRNYTVTIISQNAPLITAIKVVNGHWPILWNDYNEYNWTRQSIGAPVLSITTPSTSTSPPNATVGVPYSFQFSATGAPGAYNWTISRGALPPGLNFSLMGRITGTPTAVSKLGPFTVQVVDGKLSDEDTYTLWALTSKKSTPPVAPSTCWGTCGGPEGPVGGYFAVSGGKVQDFEDTQACLGATSDGFTYYLEIAKDLPITSDAFSYSGPASVWNGMAKTGTNVSVTLAGKFTTSTTASVTLNIDFGQCGTSHLTIHAVPD